MIEVAHLVRQNEHQSAARPDDPLPFDECLDGVGDVLKTVRGEQEIVLIGFDFGQVGSLGDELPTGLIAEELERVPASSRPSQIVSVAKLTPSSERTCL